MATNTNGSAMNSIKRKDLVEYRKFLYYEVPQIYNDDGTEILGAKDRWLELVNYIACDFEWLLGLPFYEFWSNVVFNFTIGDSLVAFLQESPVFYDLERFPNDQAMQKLLDCVRRDVLVLFTRLVSSKGDKNEFITHQDHAAYLYKNYLLTVPMMLDICQLYGRENGEIVEKIINTAIKLQPLYNDDFMETIPFFTQILKTIAERVQNRPIPAMSGPILLSEQRPVPAVMTLSILEDLVIHLLDVSSTISIFLEIYTPGIDFMHNESFINEIVHCYGNTIPEMYNKIDALAYKDETMIQYIELKHKLDVTRVELLKIFHTITYRDVANILDNPDPTKAPEAKEQIERFLDFFDIAISERNFILDYNSLFPVEPDLDLVSQICDVEINSDPVKRNYILQSVYAMLDETKQSRNPFEIALSNVAGAVVGPIGSQQNVPEIPASIQNGESSNGPTEKSQVELACLIAEVKDILCDLGEGFIEKCLKHFNNNSAAVINSILEGTLPECLKSLDRMLPHIPPDPMEASAEVDRELGTERLNVFDNDEFDVMTRDNIDKTRIHKGKRKDKYKNLGQLLDDKSYLKDSANIYEKYSNVVDDYDDEYDDTYDTHDVGPRDVDEPVEIDGRAITTPRVLRWNEKRETGAVDDVEEESEDEGPSRPQNGRENFVQDPAELRARAEQRRLSKRGGGGGSGTGRGSKGPQPDVVGKPKGQGNDKNVLINRDKKNTHKASRANHNRRSGADHKRRQGMVPS